MGISSNSSAVVINSLKLITFDATGTLLKFRKPPSQIYVEFGKKYGITVNEEELAKSFRTQWKLLNQSHPHFGTSWQSWWTQFVVGTFKGSNPSGNMDESTLNKLAGDLIDHFRTTKCWELKPGAKELLAELSKFKINNGLKIGVISNFDPRLRELLKAVSISDHFDFLVLSHEVQMSKPNPAIFNHAVKEYLSRNKNQDGHSKDSEVMGDRSLHIGDNYELDYLGALSAGWKSALIISGESEKALPVKLPSHAEFNSLEQLCDFLTAR